MPRSAPPDAVPHAPARRRPGRPEAAPEARRSVTMGVRVSATERARLEAKAAAVGVPVTAFLRLAADAVVPRAVLQVNREQWAELAHLARTLGRLERALAGMRTPLMPAEVLGQLDAFRPVVSDLAGGVFALRNALLGRDPTGRPIQYPDDSPGDVAADSLVLDAADDEPGSGPDSGDAGGGIGAEFPPLDVPARVVFPPAAAPVRGGAVPALVPEPASNFAPGHPSPVPIASDGTATQTPEVGADARS
jgi:hypothetical protein